MYELNRLVRVECGKDIRTDDGTVFRTTTVVHLVCATLRPSSGSEQSEPRVAHCS